MGGSGLVAKLGFRQAVQNQTGLKAGGEQDAQGPIEVMVRDGLAGDALTALRRLVQIRGYRDRVGCDQVAISIGVLD